MRAPRAGAGLVRWWPADGPPTLPPAMPAMRTFALGSILLALGCGESPASRASASAPEVGPLRDGDASSDAGSSATTPTPVDAIARCREAKRRALTARHDDAGAAVRALLRGCADVYAVAACRQAHLRAADEATDPSQRVRIYTDGCRAAYCPLLPEPRPAMCTASAELDLAALGPAWSELQRAIVFHDHGPEGLARLMADDPMADMRPTVQVEVDALGVRVVLASPLVARTEVALEPSGDAHALTEAARAFGLSQGVVVHADASVPYAALVRVLDALREAGATGIALRAATGGEPDAGPWTGPVVAEVGAWRRAGCSLVGPAVAPADGAPEIHVANDLVALDGRAVARGPALAGSRVERIDPLYRALRELRVARADRGLPEVHAVVVVADRDASALLTKSVVQTAAFAGFPEVSFVSCPAAP